MPPARYGNCQHPNVTINKALRRLVYSVNIKKARIGFYWKMEEEFKSVSTQKTQAEHYYDEKEHSKKWRRTLLLQDYEPWRFP